MKPNIGLALLAAVALPAAALSQIRGSAPQYQGAFEAVVDNSYVPLERGTGMMQASAKMLGGAQTYYGFGGGKSPVRFQSSQRPYFVVKAETYDTDPADSLFLYALTSKGGERRLVIMDRGIYGSAKLDTTASKYRVSVSYEKAGPGLMKLTPSGPLPRGEYMLTVSMPSKGFLFGVD
jgi:hypothetical protein